MLREEDGYLGIARFGGETGFERGDEFVSWQFGGSDAESPPTGRDPVSPGAIVRSRERGGFVPLRKWVQGLLTSRDTAFFFLFFFWGVGVGLLLSRDTVLMLLFVDEAGFFFIILYSVVFCLHVCL